MVELIYAGSVFEYEEYCVKHNLIGKAHYLNDPMALFHVPEGSVLRPVGSYARRMDYGQVAEICAKRKITFNA